MFALDNFYPNENELEKFFHEYIWQGKIQLVFNNVGSDEETHAHSWSSNLDAENFEQVEFINSLYKRVIKFENVLNCKIKKWHANIYPSGFDGTIHTDYNEENKPTFLFCSNSRWEPEWGGEFIIYNDQKEATKVFSYKPNRLIVFDGRLPHRAVAPTRVSSLLRSTIAFQCETNDYSS